MGAVTEPLTVVVVDDSAVQRRFLRGAIEAATEFTVVGEARNGKEAVALVERLRPAAVVMDLDLPVMGGVEAIDATVGKGKLFLFGPEITFRAQPAGTFKFLFNGIYMGARATGGPSSTNTAAKH